MKDIESFHATLRNPDISKYLEGPKEVRLHIYINSSLNKIVREDCAKYNITITKYILYHVLSFGFDNMPRNIDEALTKTNILLENKKLHFKNEKNGENTYMANSPKQEKEPPTEQLHLRITKACHEEIKKKAAMYSMSVNDFIVFAILHYDLSETARKINEINDKLDKLLKNG